MTSHAEKLATFDELMALPEGTRADLINGELIYHAQPLPRHGLAQAGLGDALRAFRGKGGPRGPGGWWIVAEAGVRYAANTACRHDVAGWRRSRAEVLPDREYVDIMPDWVCEIISPSSRKDDLIRKKAILHKAKIQHYWLIDPADKTLSVLRWHDLGYLSIADVSSGETVKLEPFEAVEIDVAALFADD